MTPAATHPAPAGLPGAAIAHARAEGGRDGASAAAWYLPASPDPATCRRLLAGIGDGDPAVLDELPAPDLSGLWGGDPSGQDVYAAACGAAGLGPAGPGTDGLYTDVCGAYEDAFTTAVQDEITRIACYHTT